MLNYLVYNGTSTLDFGTYLSGAGAFEVPKRDVSKVQIPGRNGDLIVDNERYSNVQVTYPLIIMENFEANKRNLIHKFSSYAGYSRLEDTFMPDFYRLAYFDGIEDSKTNWHYDAGHFTMMFDCKPQLYYKSGEQPITVSGRKTIFNFTQFDSLPLIKITGTGGFYINTDRFNLLNNTSVVYVDSELREVYEGTINRNDDFERNNNELPKLYAGENVIICDNGISLEIVPRWWTI